MCDGGARCYSNSVNKNTHVFLLCLFSWCRTGSCTPLFGLPNPAAPQAVAMAPGGNPATIYSGATSNLASISSMPYRSASSGSKMPGPFSGAIVNLKKPVKVSETKEINEYECQTSMFMSPFHYPVPFSQNDTIYERIEQKCRWNLIGTEPCIPTVTCNTGGMRKCDDEFLEIADGGEGFLKVCKGTKVDQVKATGGLRDLYLKVKVVKPLGAYGEYKAKGKILFNCTAVCTPRGSDEGNELPKTYKRKNNAKCSCGVKPNDERIVNGETAKKFEFPWLVALVEANTRQPFCGGSIVNNRFILTAGHCIKGKFMDYTNIHVMVNGHLFDSSPNSGVLSHATEPKTYPPDELNRLDVGNGSTRFRIDQIIVHPMYVSENNDYDIALLHLDKPVDLTTKAKPGLQQPRQICLPPLGAYLRTFSNKKAIIAGWGLPGMEAEGTPQVLQKLEVNVFSPQACKEMFAHRVNRRMMCAGHREGGKDACSGDSGGPLVVEEKPKMWMQVGSVSWGEGCAEENQPGVYFRSTEAVQWINYESNYYENDDKKPTSWCILPQ